MTRSAANHTSSWAGRVAWLSLVVVLIALTGVSSTAQQGQGQARGQMLFEPRGETDGAAPGQADRTRKRGRRVRANAGALAQPDAPGGAAAITLNLFDDVQLRARKHQLEATSSGGLVWKGRLLDVAGEATFAIQDGVIAGTVFAGDKVYEVLYAGGGEHDVREIEPSEFPTDDPHADLPSIEPDPQAGAMDAAVAAEMAGDAASQIDVMVIWTPAARTAAGGTSAIQSLVDLAVANMNSAYANSAVTQRARLVYSGELAYSESSPSTDLSRLAMTTDGYLDTVHTLRNTYGADVVTLLGEGYVNAGACGVGYLMTSVSTGFASSAFNVVDRTCAAGNLTYAHEMGHNMGLQHDPANAGSSPAYSYAYGYQEPTGLFRTVMAYACPTGSCPRLTYFANPAVSYNGRPTGAASQNTALALNNTAPSVANFRQAVTGSCTYALGSTSTSVGSGTATSSVSVTAATGCAWTATSNASWLTITSGASGSGGGTPAFSVAANTAGTSRSGTLTVAGQTFTVSQAAAACGAVSLSPASQSVTAAGGPVSVGVTGTPGCAWTATSTPTWITITAGASGTGTGTVSLSVAANTSGAARTGTVTVGGQSVTVTQAAAPCTYSLSPGSASVSAGSGTGSFTLTTQPGCSGPAISNVLWIAVTSGATGTASRLVTYSVAANSSGAARTGTVGVLGQLFTVSQPKRGNAGSRATTSAKADFDGDSKADLLLRHDEGYVSLWKMNGLVATEQAPLDLGLVSPVWQIAGTGDLDGDGRPEIVWRHRIEGLLCAWFMNGAVLQEARYLNPNRVATSWRIAAVADMNGDAKADLIWQHDSGLLAVWHMDGLNLMSDRLLNPTSVAGSDWKIVGAGDMNGDGKADLIWQHQSGGWLSAWLMDDATLVSAVYLTPNRISGPDWKIRAVVDIDDDGNTDLIWQHESGGLVAAWLMNGVSATSTPYLSPDRVASQWRLAGPR